MVSAAAAGGGQVGLRPSAVGASPVKIRSTRRFWSFTRSILGRIKSSSSPDFSPGPPVSSHCKDDLERRSLIKEDGSFLKRRSVV